MSSMFLDHDSLQLRGSRDNTEIDTGRPSRVRQSFVVGTTGSATVKPACLNNGTS